MPTGLDRALQSRSAFIGFAGIISAVAMWSIWGGGDMFPKEPEPAGEPENWTDAELRRWLNAHNLIASTSFSREELITRVKDNLRSPRA